MPGTIPRYTQTPTRVSRPCRIAVFKARAEMSGANYQTLMNEALAQCAQGVTLADVVRDTIRQELHHA